MLDEGLLERAVRFLASHWGEARLLSERQRFEEATGAIQEGAPDYEFRIAHFFEQCLCEDDADGPPVAHFARTSPELSQADRAQLAGWLRSHRSLLRFEGWDEATGKGRIRDLLWGGSYHFEPRPEDRQLNVGDRFDGRLVPIGDALYLSPGRVYHPQAAHGAMDTLLEGVRAQAPGRKAALDGLLRMRARFFQFESIRAEHVYRLDALSEPTFAAPWARPARRE